MRNPSGLVLVVALVCAAGCSSYKSARLVASHGEAREAPEIFGVIEGREFAKRVQVKLPAELVVAEVRADVQAGRFGEADERGTQLIQALSVDAAVFDDVAPLFVATGRMADLRAAAARQHADLVLVTTIEERVEERGNALGVLKLLVLPCFFVPTETADVRLHLRAAIIDVRNDLVYATFEDHKEERVFASAYGEKDAIESGFDRLYADSLAKLRTRVTDRLKKLESQASGGD